MADDGNNTSKIVTDHKSDGDQESNLNSLTLRKPPITQPNLVVIFNYISANPGKTNQEIKAKMNRDPNTRHISQSVNTLLHNSGYFEYKTDGKDKFWYIKK